MKVLWEVVKDGWLHTVTLSNPNKSIKLQETK